MHPLVNNITELKESDLELKISDLTRKYFMTNNSQLQQQISDVLEVYKEALSERRRITWEQTMESRNKDLDKLIKVD